MSARRSDPRLHCQCLRSALGLGLLAMTNPSMPRHERAEDHRVRAATLPMRSVSIQPEEKECSCSAWRTGPTFAARGAWRQLGRARISSRGRGVMRRLGANGTTIAYAGTGTGLPFVLAHGAEGSTSAPLPSLASSQVLATRGHSRNSAGRLNISSAQLRSAQPLPCNLTPRKPKCARSRRQECSLPSPMFHCRADSRPLTSNTRAASERAMRWRLRTTCSDMQCIS